MKDIEARGIVLQFLYEHRRGNFYPEREISPLFQEVGRNEFYRICEQLIECRLVEWDASQVPSKSGGYEWSAHAIKITAAGVDVVESDGRNSPIPVTIQTFNFPNSQGVQIGNSNSQSLSVSINQVLRSIDDASATEKEKEEARGRLRSFLEHPLVTTLVGAGASALLGALK